MGYHLVIVIFVTESNCQLDATERCSFIRKLKATESDMRLLVGAAVAATFAQVVSAVPQDGGSKLHARQGIDFDLVDSTPDPTVQPGDTSNFDPAAAIASVIAEVKAGTPLSEERRDLEARDIVVSIYPGYTQNVLLGNAAINAPLDCNGRVGPPFKSRLAKRWLTNYLRTHIWA